MIMRRAAQYRCVFILSSAGFSGIGRDGGKSPSWMILGAVGTRWEDRRLAIRAQVPWEGRTGEHTLENAGRRVARRSECVALRTPPTLGQAVSAIRNHPNALSSTWIPALRGPQSPASPGGVATCAFASIFERLVSFSPALGRLTFPFRFSAACTSPTTRCVEFRRLARPLGLVGALPPAASASTESVIRNSCASTAKPPSRPPLRRPPQAARPVHSPTETAKGSARSASSADVVSAPVHALGGEAQTWVRARMSVGAARAPIPYQEAATRIGAVSSRTMPREHDPSHTRTAAANPRPALRARTPAPRTPTRTSQHADGLDRLPGPMAPLLPATRAAASPLAHPKLFKTVLFAPAPSVKSWSPEL
ncbi:hypothetical protein DFH07DRAFT_1066767 [Mycena maculata]|uniref:Uncharacterized protein n=1 Tax=Mycena maculata TaxID=230809 RepID=A0AAD7HRR2_9AGAR|nr:hypothetical protein DFH07DRAFT_1066767 [Mycena maculata]